MEAPALFLCDPEGRIASWNRGCEKVFGWEEAELIGVLGRILFTPEDNATGQFEKENLRAIEFGIADDIRWHVAKNGNRVYITGQVVCLRDDDGNLLGFAKIMNDTTEEQIAHERVALRLLTAQEDERRRIARELHDDLSQRLAMLELGLSEIEQKLPDGLGEVREELVRLRSQVGSAASEVRRVSHQLHPSIVDDLGLCAAIQSLCEEFQAGRDQKIDFLDKDVPDSIPPGLALVFYRIVQEALRNVAKHVTEGPVTVMLSATASELCLTIEDSGPGFDVATAGAKGGLGLKSMDERAHLVGGSFTITSEPGQGTAIDVRAPISRT